MPRGLLKVLKACWTALAWLLLVAGVIGCDGGARATAPGAARTEFESFQELLSYYDFVSQRTETKSVISIHVSGDVANAGRATPAEIAAFAEVATRPATIAAFAAVGQCPAIGDGADEVTLTLAGGRTYMRSSTCTDLEPVVSAARELAETVRARAAHD